MLLEEVWFQHDGRINPKTERLYFADALLRRVVHRIRLIKVLLERTSRETRAVRVLEKRFHFRLTGIVVGDRRQCSCELQQACLQQ